MRLSTNKQPQLTTPSLKVPVAARGHQNEAHDTAKEASTLSMHSCPKTLPYHPVAPSMALNKFPRLPLSIQDKHGGSKYDQFERAEAVKIYRTS